jgi:magnesium transporter
MVSNYGERSPADGEIGARPYDDQADQLIREVRSLLRQGDHITALLRFDELHPADQGQILATIDPEPRRDLLSTLTPNEMADILEQLEPEEAVGISREIETSRLAQILDAARPDVAADILKDLPDERSNKTLEDMGEVDEILPLLQYDDDVAGGRMTPEYPVLRENLLTQIALDQLRLFGSEAENISNVFVTDDDGTLVGSLGIVKLALSRPSSAVRDLMDRDVISVRTDADQEEIARLMERYGVNRLPVIDENGRFVGVIFGEDILHVVEEEATEDMYRIVGLPDERVFGPVFNSVRGRLPWLSVNLATVFLAALVISLFESTLGKMIALAAFLPVVAGQGGIGGMQTVTLVVRSMALGGLPAGTGHRLLMREIRLGLMHGLFLGIAVGVTAAIWKGNWVLGLVLCIAMVGNMMIAALAGAGVPLLLRRLRLDPAASSAVFVTTLTDVFGFLLFLGMAAVFIQSLT